MASRTTELKYLRRILQQYSEDFLNISGMDFYHDCFFYKYCDDAIYFADIYLSGGWRGEGNKGLACCLNIFYKDFPGFSKPKIHETGNAIPTNYRLRFGMERTLDQSSIIDTLNKPSLKYDRNFWHVLDDESNIKEVLENIATVIRDIGLPLVQKPIYSRAVKLEKEKKLIAKKL